MLYKLFSATGRCMPCRMLIQNLDLQFPEWKDYVEYIDVDGSMTKEQIELADKLGIRRIPSFTTEDKVIPLGHSPSGGAKKIKELCLTKE